MSTHPSIGSAGDSELLDVVGVGFGPSNLALAIALDEREEDLRVEFFERQQKFGWHTGMLMDGATMQISFLKDLVTVRDPTSPYSFLAYLHDRGRLVDFVNHKSLFPSRAEFHDYLEWTAGPFREVVRYGFEVTAIEPVCEGGVTEYFLVTATDAEGQSCQRAARNVVLAPGLRPSVPAGVELSDRVWHNQELLHRLAKHSDHDLGSFVVVGAGQSAAECTEYLHRWFPGAHVYSVFGRYGYSPSDDSPFANRIFDPEAVDHFYAAPELVKKRLFEYHRNTNYSVVDIDLIEELYRRAYQEKVTGTERLHVLSAHRMISVSEVDSRVHTEVEFLPDFTRQVLHTDVFVSATGYESFDPAELIDAPEGFFVRDELGRVRVGRDYRATTADPSSAGVYLQGGTEHSHGITSALLSNTAVRAGEIAESVTDNLAQIQRDSVQPAAV